MADNLSRAIADSLPPDNGMRVGIVQSINPLVVTIQGAPVTLVGQLTASASVGDPVALIRQDQSWLVLGAIVNSEAAPDGNAVDQTVTNITDSTTSATLVPLVGWVPLAFHRARANSRLDMQLTFGARPTVAVPVSALYGLRFTHTETGEQWTPTIIPAATYSTASVHLSHTTRRVQTPAPALGAGDMTIEVMWRRSTGAGTLNTASGFDTIGVVVKEL